MKRCVTCPHTGVMADLEEILVEMEKDGAFRPTVKRLFHILKDRHPDWGAGSVSALREHLDRHDHERNDAFFVRR